MTDDNRMFELWIPVGTCEACEERKADGLYSDSGGYSYAWIKGKYEGSQVSYSMWLCEPCYNEMKAEEEAA